MNFPNIKLHFCHFNWSDKGAITRRIPHEGKVSSPVPVTWWFLMQLFYFSPIIHPTTDKGSWSPHESSAHTERLKILARLRSGANRARSLVNATPKNTYKGCRLVVCSITYISPHFRWPRGDIAKCGQCPRISVDKQQFRGFNQSSRLRFKVARYDLIFFSFGYWESSLAD